MTKAVTHHLLVPSNARLFTGMFIVPVSILSIVLILAANPHPLFAIFPMPTLIMGTAMITLELRNRMEKRDAIVERLGTTPESQLHDRKLGEAVIDNVGSH